MTLVFLHGIGTGPEAWQPQIDALGADRVVLAPPLGFDAGFTIEREAERLLRDLPDGPLDLCGLSLGALVALRIALIAPDRVARLVLCCGFASLPHRYRALQALVGPVVSLLPERARGGLGDLDGRGIRAVFREGRRFDVSAELGDVTMPVLVLAGERDGVNRGLSQTLAAALPDARLEIVPGAGHVANVDAPQAFTGLLRSFLDGASPQP